MIRLAEAIEVARDALLEDRGLEAREILSDSGADAEDVIDGLTRCDSAGVSVLGDDQAGAIAAAERGRRRATLARAKAGVTPIARPEDVTYEDEPEEVVVRVPLLASVRLPGGGSTDWFTPEQVAYGIERDRAVARWQAETARVPLETVPLEPEET